MEEVQLKEYPPRNLGKLVMRQFELTVTDLIFGNGNLIVMAFAQPDEANGSWEGPFEIYGSDGTLVYKSINDLRDLGVKVAGSSARLEFRIPLLELRNNSVKSGFHK